MQHGILNLKNRGFREKCSKPAKIQKPRKVQQTSENSKIAKSTANQRKFELLDLKNGGFRERYYTSAKFQGTVT